MKTILVAIILFYFASGVSAQYFRMGSIMDSYTSFQTISHDRYTLFTHANYLNSYQHQNWKTFVDGHDVTINILGTPIVNATPYAASIIDETVYANQFTHLSTEEFGGIRFSTREVKEGFHGFGKIKEGNEVFDPGPYKFTEFNSSNIDGIGNDSYLQLSYKKKRLSIVPSLIYQRHAFTDDQISFRVDSQLNDVWAAGIRINPSLKVDFETQKLFASALLSYSEFSLYPIFLAQYGGEIPSDFSSSIISTIGTYELSDKSSISYNLNYKDIIVERSEESRDDFEFDFNTKELKSSLSYILKKKNFSSETGLNLSTLFASGNGISDETYNLIKLFGNIDYTFKPDLSIISQLVFKVSEDELGVSISSKLNFFKNEQLSVGAGYHQILSNEQHSFVSWIHRGFQLIPPSAYNHNYSEADEMGVLKKYSLISVTGLVKNIYISPSISIEGNIAYRRWDDLLLDDHNYSVVRFSRIAPEELQAENAWGSIMGAQFKLSQKINHTLQYSLGYSGYKIINGTLPFKADWNKFNPTSFLYGLDFSPDELLKISGSYNFRVGGFWKEFEGFDVFGRDYSQPDNYHLVNLYIRYKMFNTKMELGFTLENILNQPIKYHPLGMINRMSLFVEIGIKF